MSLTTQLGQTIQGLVNMIALPAGYRLIEKLKTLLHPTASAKQEIYIVYGKQPSPYPDLSCIDPIIAVMTSEQDCYALEKLHIGIIISWETRTVQDDEKPALENGDTIYLTHSSLLPYMVDNSGNDVFGIVESPSPTAAYRNRKTAQQKAPDFYLQEVVIGEVNLQGAGKILD